MRRPTRIPRDWWFAILVGLAAAVLLSAGRAGKIALIAGGLLLIAVGLVLHRQVVAGWAQEAERRDGES